LYKDIEFNAANIFLRTEVEQIPNIFLFKGITSDSAISDYLLTDLENFSRPSKTAKKNGNLYNLLLNNLDNWKKYPLREKSIILTDSQNIAKSFSTTVDEKYGKTFYVFPRQNSSIVLSPNDDIWYSFRRGLTEIGLRGNDADLILFNDLFYEIFSSCNIVDFDQNFELFIEHLNSLIKGEIKPQSHLNFKSQLLYEKLVNLNLDAKELLENVFDPDSNGFEIKQYNKEFALGNRNIEMWTNEQCLLINVDKFDAFTI